MPLRVLVVDDDDDIRKLLELSLGALEEVELVGQARDGGEAVEKVEVLRPDIVVMDLMMPNMDGAQATEMIKRLFPEVVVIGFTAMESDGLEKLVRAGATSVIEKTSFPRLMELIKTLRSGTDHQQ